jgi:hypothetical protein
MEASQRLADDLQRDTSAIAILTCLRALVASFEDPVEADKRALLFVRAGGLPPVIHHLRGTVTADGTPDQGITSNAISSTAAEAVLGLLTLSDVTVAEHSVARGVIPSLLDALRDAPSMLGRSKAAYVLFAIANAHPKECRTIADAGVVGLVLAFYNDIYSLPSGIWESNFATELAGPPGALVRVLVQLETGAANDLRRAICARAAAPAFNALLLAQVTYAIYGPAQNHACCMRNSPSPVAFVACDVSVPVDTHNRIVPCTR